MLFFNPVRFAIAGVLSVVVMFGFGFFLQYGLGLEPCPLCMLQRGAFFGVGAGMLIVALLASRPWMHRLGALISLLSAGVGIGLAGRHLWIQSLPPEEVPACGLGWDFMIDTYSLDEVIVRTLSGGDCAEVQLFLGLTIPLWSLMAFLGYLAASLWLFRLAR